MAGPNGGDLFDTSMGDDVRGGSIEFGNGKDGNDHHNIHGDGWHRSWDTDASGNVSRDHVTTHDDGEKYNINP